MSGMYFHWFLKPMLDAEAIFYVLLTPKARVTGREITVAQLQPHVIAAVPLVNPRMIGMTLVSDRVSFAPEDNARWDSVALAYGKLAAPQRAKLVVWSKVDPVELVTWRPGEPSPEEMSAMVSMTSEQRVSYMMSGPLVRKPIYMDFDEGVYTFGGDR